MVPPTGEPEGGGVCDNGENNVIYYMVPVSGFGLFKIRDVLIESIIEW